MQMQNYSQLKIGVLALQGAVAEHLQQIRELGATAVAVKQVQQLSALDGLILPGGESTAISKLMRNYGFIQAIREFSAQNKAIFGTCAGMILLAKSIVGGEQSHLQLMDIEVKRNAFGRQIASFQTPLEVKGIASPVPAVFIRAPYIQSAATAVEILAKFEQNIVLARQNNLLACAFHPELSQDLRIMQLFLDMAVEKTN